MADFSFKVSPNILLGSYAASRIGQTVASFGSKFMLILDPILRENGTCEKITKALDDKKIEYFLFDELSSGGDSEILERTLKLAREAHVHGVIAVGGLLCIPFLDHLVKEAPSFPEPLWALFIIVLANSVATQAFNFTGQMLTAGMKVLLKVYPQFHEAYGFSWIVTGIDPTFTLGDMAQRRQQIIQKLKEEGVFDLQRELVIPSFCQRIAVISAETAAGYGDFCRQLLDNDYGLQFYPTLFPAIMQGEQVEQSVIAALNQINRQADDFDVVVIIRGGGSTSDMSGFDTLALAENVANFPLPIITGIGHDRDECVLDMISNTRVKTPTAAAAFLISHLADTLQHVIDIQQRISFMVTMLKTNLEHQLEQRDERILHALQQRIVGERHHLEMAEQRTTLLDPTLLLSRGYSITLHNGKALRDTQQLKAGDEIETRVEKGTIKSTVTWKQ